MVLKTIFPGLFALFVGAFIMHPAHGQDVLLRLSGKEIPCVVTSVDTFFIEYYPLGKLEMVEKSTVNRFTSRQFFMKDGSVKDAVLDVQSYDAAGPYLFYRQPLPRKKTKDRYNFFAYTRQTFDTLIPAVDSIPIRLTERVLYEQDSMHIKFELMEQEMRAYVYGRRSARKNFHSPLSTLGGIAVGFAGGYILNFFYAALPSAVYATVNGTTRPKMKVTGAEDAPYIQDEFFEEGYRDQARIIKAKNSVFGTLPALAIGMLLRYFGTLH